MVTITPEEQTDEEHINAKLIEFFMSEQDPTWGS